MTGKCLHCGCRFQKPHAHLQWCSPECWRAHKNVKPPRVECVSTRPMVTRASLRNKAKLDAASVESWNASHDDRMKKIQDQYDSLSASTPAASRLKAVAKILATSVRVSKSSWQNRCAMCARVFTSGCATRSTCSRECRAKLRNQQVQAAAEKRKSHAGPPPAKPLATCEWCHKPYPRSSQSNICSQECRQARKAAERAKTNRNCVVCGQPFRKTSGRMVTCGSPSCFKTHMSGYCKAWQKAKLAQARAAKSLGITPIAYAAMKFAEQFGATNQEATGS